MEETESDVPPEVTPPTAAAQTGGAGGRCPSPVTAAGEIGGVLVAGGLLVVGSRGNATLAGMLLGSVNWHCVQLAPRALVVVPR